VEKTLRRRSVGHRRSTKGRPFMDSTRNKDGTGSYYFEIEKGKNYFHFPHRSFRSGNGRWRVGERCHGTFEKKEEKVFLTTEEEKPRPDHNNPIRSQTGEGSSKGGAKGHHYCGLHHPNHSWEYPRSQGVAGKTKKVNSTSKEGLRAGPPHRAPPEGGENEKRV